MADDVRDAQAALRRGATDEALVLLWNAVEPARLAGDRRALRAIERMAEAIAAADEGYRREGERLRDAVQSITADEPAVAATERVEAEVLAGGEPVETVEAPAPADRPPMELPEEAETAGRGPRFGPLIWVVIVAAYLLLNFLGDRG